MGGRVSVPRGADGMSEASKVPAASSDVRRPRRFNSRSLLVPIGAIALGGIFFVYSRTSIQAAKEHARRHREADGGTISWRNESKRRHGTLEKPAERTIWQQLISGTEDEAAGERREKEAKRLEMLGNAGKELNPIEEGIRRARQGRVVSRGPEDDD